MDCMTGRMMRGGALAAGVALLGGCGVDGPPVAPQAGPVVLRPGPPAVQTAPMTRGQTLSSDPTVTVGGRVAAGMMRAG